MIAFSCPACGMKFRVKTQFAGRSSKCPTCKQALTVPEPERTVAHVPAGEIDGTASSVHQAGVDGGVTLEPAGKGGGQKSIREVLARQTKKGQRYIVESEIARGGMGAVLRAIDRDIRREVAVKFMLDERDPKKKARFVEEAQITGQLEHPNIVPIHELGVDAKGRLFFSMKMVKGRSLAQVLDELRNPPSSLLGKGGQRGVAEKEYSLGRLLNIFVNVCHALAYAHSRGVVHRDLKPANIMLGDFGEVYVMDWGLAKVLKGASQAAAAVGRVVPPSVPPGATVSSSRSSKVETSREGDADLTQEGAILGTPVYMPPEQANGQIDGIDQRSDVYSLGAILYEMVTLQPPVEKEGGYLAILMRVCQGEIVRPEARVPQRAGRIPKELSAVAMKALAKNAQDRYPNVEALRRDIERFQEGRSVSAKEDTVREAVWKLVKRNKAVSLVTTTATLLLAFVLARSSWVNYQAVLAMEKAQDDQRTQAVASVPAYLRAARLAVNEREFPDALVQVNTALRYQPGHADALLLRGQLLIVLQRFSDALVDLDRYVGLRPAEVTAKKLAELCRKAQTDEWADLRALGQTLRLQKAYPLDEQMFRLAEKFVKSRQEQLGLYQLRIEGPWPGLGKSLKIGGDGKFHLSFHDLGGVRDLMPLKGMPLTSLNVAGTWVRDLTPLAGMPLKSLYCYKTEVTDLTPLGGMELEEVRFTPKRINGGMEVLRRMKSLKTIGIEWNQSWSAAEFWKKYDAGEFNK